MVTLASLDPRLRSRSRREAALLSPEEEALFMSMTRYDLAHSLAVAEKLKDDRLLFKAGLLHDSGKLHGELGLFTRWLYTALEITAPSCLKRVARSIEAGAHGSGIMERTLSLPRGWRRGMFVQLHHGEIAAEILRHIGCEEELIRLVGSHQGLPGNELERRLREADDSL
jgi:putative nucleotidyltransferase with HDIG domain